MEIIGTVLVSAVVLMVTYHVVRLAVRAGVREALAERDRAEVE